MPRVRQGRGPSRRNRLTTSVVKTRQVSAPGQCHHSLLLAVPRRACKIHAPRRHSGHSSGDYHVRQRQQGHARTGRVSPVLPSLACREPPAGSHGSAAAERAGDHDYRATGLPAGLAEGGLRCRAGGLRLPPVGGWRWPQGLPARGQRGDARCAHAVFPQHHRPWHGRAHRVLSRRGGAQAAPAAAAFFRRGYLVPGVQ